MHLFAFLLKYLQLTHDPHKMVEYITLHKAPNYHLQRTFYNMRGLWPVYTWY